MSLRALPPPVREILLRIERTGREATLVGRCVRELLAGGTAADFEVLTEAAPSDLLRLFPRAVVTGPRGGRLTLPTRAGPIDLSPLPDGLPLERTLERRDFTLHAIGYQAGPDRFVDPLHGRRDLEARLLRAGGSAKERIAEDPVRALRAARLVAELGLTVDAELENALPAAADALSALLGARGRRMHEELSRLLVAPGADQGLDLLKRCGLERAIAPGAADDAVAVIARLPQDLELRLAAWLRGARVRAVLRDLRCPRDLALRVERILQLHPIDAGSAAARESRARRLARQPPHEWRRLVALREAELRAAGASTSSPELDQLSRALERALRADDISARRASLALGGREVMAHLGCGPGARVGRALRYLAERVADDPSLNEPETLRRLLDRFAERPDA